MLNFIKRSLIAVKDHFQVFIQTPKDYLSLYLIPRPGLVKIKPFSKKLKQLASELMDEIHKLYPELKLYLIGSVGLEVSGQDDIDLIAATEPENFSNYEMGLSKIFGIPGKKRKFFREWRTKKDYYTIDFVLYDKDSELFKKEMGFFGQLKNNKKLRAEYEQLKLKLNGFPDRTYVFKRMQFFNQIKE